MYPAPDLDVVLFELEERRRQAQAHRLAGAYQQRQARDTGRLRWMLGSSLLRLGTAVMGDDQRLRSDVAG